jgi:hypothetical protein
MKQDPITYRIEVKENRGFSPFKNKDGEYVYQRDILCKPFTYKGGSAISFEIVEHFSKDGVVQPYQRKLCSESFYDAAQPAYKELITNLTSNELRGYCAEATAQKLYWELFAFF